MEACERRPLPISGSSLPLAVVTCEPGLRLDAPDPLDSQLLVELLGDDSERPTVDFTEAPSPAPGSALRSRRACRLAARGSTGLALARHAPTDRCPRVRPTDESTAGKSRCRCGSHAFVLRDTPQTRVRRRVDHAAVDAVVDPTCEIHPPPGVRANLGCERRLRIAKLALRLFRGSKRRGYTTSIEEVRLTKSRQERPRLRQTKMGPARMRMLQKEPADEVEPVTHVRREQQPRILEPAGGEHECLRPKSCAASSEFTHFDRPHCAAIRRQLDPRRRRVEQDRQAFWDRRRGRRSSRTRSGPSDRRIARIESRAFRLRAPAVAGRPPARGGRREPRRPPRRLCERQCNTARECSLPNGQPLCGTHGRVSKSISSSSAHRPPQTAVVPPKNRSRESSRS